MRMKRCTTGVVCVFLALTAAQSRTCEKAETMQVLRRVNNYFMGRYADPTLPTMVKRSRTSNLWTRAVYYEGLMALYEIDPDARYADYTDRWAASHQWTPRYGVTTCNADDQCCGQTYLMRYLQVGGDEKISKVRENLDLQMKTYNPKANNALYGWWTWIDAIQMAMPLYFQMTAITHDQRYQQHAMMMYRWSRNMLAGGLFNAKDGLWWRDADYVAPYHEPDGKPCYWSRGNGWVYAALVRCMQQVSPKEKVYKELKKDFLAMSRALLNCQREDGFWNPSLVSTHYAMPETSGTALFLYGMAWGIRQGLLDERKYEPACRRAWQGMVQQAVHKDGFLGWMQGTGKDPSAGQPLSYDRVPDFEDYGTGCFLLGGVEYYRMITRDE